MLTADKNYSKNFHSPGLEPWVLGVLLRVKLNNMVDTSCGHGFWGFIAKRRINSLSYVAGFDLDYEISSLQYELRYFIVFLHGRS